MSDHPPSWLSEITISPAYLYREYFYCEKCSTDTAKTTNPREGYSAQFTNPIGPIKNRSVDYPVHCAAGEFCLVPVRLPSGSLLGCSLDLALSPNGIGTAAHFIASHLLYGSRSQKQIGRLWLKLCSDRFGFGHLPLLLLSSTLPKRISAHPKIKKLTSVGATLDPHILTDLHFLYGTAVTPQSTILWRMAVSDVGSLENLLTVALPLSESTERSVKDLLEEAVECSAWE